MSLREQLHRPASNGWAIVIAALIAAVGTVGAEVFEHKVGFPWQGPGGSPEGETPTAPADGADLLPETVIVASYAAASPLPPGWVICGTTEGTPQLGGKLLVGSTDGSSVGSPVSEDVGLWHKVRDTPQNKWEKHLPVEVMFLCRVRR